MPNCPTCNGTGQYDPNIIQAAEASNYADDRIDPTSDANHSFGDRHADRDASESREKLKSMLPGMTDYGIQQTKNKIRAHVGFGRNKSGAGGGPFATGK